MTQHYAQVFGDIGRLSGEHHINLKTDAWPVVHPLRKILYLLKEKLKAELERIERNEVIDKVDELTD